ncbi:right-handed parallel beta-helix repeat-containing protein, partial [Elusimicrobiota bacterium]
SVSNLDIIPQDDYDFGIRATGAYAEVDMVDLQTGPGVLQIAGLFLSTGASVITSTVAVEGGAKGIVATGMWGEIEGSTVVTTGNQPALYLVGATSWTVSLGSFTSHVGKAVQLSVNSNYNSISYSTMTAFQSGEAALSISLSSMNAVSHSYIYAPDGYAANLSVGANYNTISQSTMVNAGGSAYHALLVNAGSTNTVTGSLIRNTGANGYAAMIMGTAQFNRIELSTLTSIGSNYVLFVENASSNTFYGNRIADGASVNGVWIGGGAQYNTLSFSTVVVSGNYRALYLSNGDWNTITGTYLESPLGDAVMMDSASDNNTIQGSTAIANSSTKVAFRIWGSGNNAIDASYVRNDVGYSLTLEGGADGNTVSRSTITSAGAGYDGIFINNSDWNTVTDSYIQNLPGEGVVMEGSSHDNTVELSTVATNVAAKAAVRMTGVASNTVTGSVISNPFGWGVVLTTGAMFNTVELSTITGVLDVMLHIVNSSWNTVTDSYMHGGFGPGAVLQNAKFNTIERSTIASTSAGREGFRIEGSSWNTITQNVIMNDSNHALMINNGSVGNVVSKSSITSNAGTKAAVFITMGSEDNTVSESHLSNASGYALFIAASSSNTVKQSTMVHLNNAASKAVYLYTASSTTISDSYIESDWGDGIYAENYSDYLRVEHSTIIADAGGASGNGVRIIDSSAAVVYRSYIEVTSAFDTGFIVQGDSPFFTLAESTVVVPNTDTSSLYLTNSGSHTITGSYISGGSYYPIYMSNVSGSTITMSTMVAGNRTALYMVDSIGNVVTDSMFIAARETVYLNNSGYNTVSRSTITATNSSYPALYVLSSGSNTVQGNYIQGNTDNTSGGNPGVVNVLSSTRTKVSGNRIVATHGDGAGVMVQDGDVYVDISTNVISGGKYGISLGPFNMGTLMMASNTIREMQVPIIVKNQTNAEVWITSNTILPAVGGGMNTYGILLDTLVSGATIHNNSIYFRKTGDNTGFTARGIYATMSGNLYIHNNRINNPGMVSGGSFAGVELQGSSNVRFESNDVHSTGTALTNARLLYADSGSCANLRVWNNIFSSSMTTSGTNSNIEVGVACMGGWVSDYNDFYSSNAVNQGDWGGGLFYDLPDEWCANTGNDCNSISVHPQWSNMEAGDEDFHPMSYAGRWDGAGFTSDPVYSMTIDAGDPAEDHSLETGSPDNSVNLGSYGNTPYASRAIDPCAARTSNLSGGSGGWSDQLSWDPPVEPTACSGVTVTAGDTVVMDSWYARSQGLNIDGTLYFSRVQHSSLTVATGGNVIVGVTGHLDMGTESDVLPEGTTAHLVLAAGTFAGANGLIVGTGGRFTVRGATKSPVAYAMTNIVPNGTSVEVAASSVTGWQKGDRIVIGPTRQTGTGIGSVDEVTITGITNLGGTYQIDWAGGISERVLVATSPVPIVNLTRNVLVRSSGTDTGANTAYIRNLSQTAGDFDLRYGEFAYLGSNNAAKYGITFGGAAVKGSISSCTIRNGYDGIYVDGSAGPSTLAQNVVALNERRGVSIDGGSDLTLLRNHLIGSSSEGVWLGNTSSSVTFTGNRFYAGATQGLTVSGGTDLTSEDDASHNNASAGVQLVGVTSGTLRGLNTYGNLGTGLYLEASSGVVVADSWIEAVSAHALAAPDSVWVRLEHSTATSLSGASNAFYTSDSSSFTIIDSYIGDGAGTAGYFLLAPFSIRMPLQLPNKYECRTSFSTALSIHTPRAPAVMVEYEILCELAETVK